MKLKRSYLAFITVWGALLITSLACGGSTGQTSPPAVAQTEASAGGPSPLDTLDPCSVVTQADATTLFGAPAEPGTPSTGPDSAFCVYATADQANHFSLNLSYIATGAIKDENYKALASLSQAVPGLGDGAFFQPSIGALTVAKGPWMMRVSGFARGALTTLDELTPVAQTALGRLP